MAKPAWRLTAAPLTAVRIEDGFWKPRMEVNRKVTLPYQYGVCAKTGRLDAYADRWTKDSMKTAVGWVELIMGDVGKWIEAAAYSLAYHPDPKLQRMTEDAIRRVLRGQKPDGYLYSRPMKPGTHWTDLLGGHEMYDAGHFMEAAAAYYEATGDPKLLDAMCRNAKLLEKVFGRAPGQKRGYCGHPEIELALFKLYRASGDRRHLQFCKYLVDERGRKPYYYDIELRARGEQPRGDSYEAFSAHRPVRDFQRPYGHAVRHLYLMSGAADLAAETGDAALLKACRRVWRKMVDEELYVHGGVGGKRISEAFAGPYELPNETCYAETCGNIALVFFAHRMLQIEAESEYADVMELALYNSVLSGMGMDGKTFFYANPLVTYPQSPEAYWRHNAPVRRGWFTCACCPPNIARMIASFPMYVYSQSPDAACVHLYAGGEARLNVAGGKVLLRQKTGYPWKGDVELSVEPEAPVKFTLALRIPGWCREAALSVNAKPVALAPVLRKGYACIRREWRKGDRVNLVLPMPVVRLEANPKVRMDSGKVALQRGPIVYCFEEADNGKNLADLVLRRDRPVTARFEPGLLGGAVTLTGEAVRRVDEGWNGALYRPVRSRSRAVSVKAIPYALRANRTVSEMIVWIRQQGDME